MGRQTVRNLVPKRFLRSRNMEFRPNVNKYKPVTRVGNWNEDMFLADEIKTDFERQKQAGTLRSQHLAQLRTAHLTPVATSPHGDKGVALGDIVMLKNLSMSLSLAVFSDNLTDYVLTAAAGDDAINRNTFKVVPYHLDMNETLIGEPLRFNQVFCLQSMCNPEYFLVSDPIKKNEFALKYCLW